MKTRFSYFVMTAVCALAILCIPPAVSLANISYSWSGHLVRDATSDPWLIGPDGAEFTLQTIVSGTDVEQYSSAVPYAGFAALSARLWIDGVEADYVGDGFIDFSDIEDSVDIVSAAGIFRKFDQTVEISTVVGLDPSTFSFQLPFESPPIFPSTQTSMSGGAGHSPYYTLVAAGAFVEVTPEPATLTLALFSLVLLSHRPFRKNRRSPAA